MDRYTSTTDMLSQMEHKQGWIRHDTAYGYTLTPPAHIATGMVSIYGEATSHCFIDADVVFHIPLLERYYVKHRGIQLSMIEDMTGEYYEKKSETNEASYGLFCFVYNIHKPVFHRHPAETIQKVSTVSLTEAFFLEHNIVLPPNAWDRMSAAIFGKITLPKLLIIMREIKNLDVNRISFDIIFRGKMFEMIGVLWEYTLEKERNELSVISKKSRETAKRALQILNDNYITPPVINALADALGVDVGTLQKSFKQMVGQTVYEYIVSLRMEKALTLLEDNALTIGDIAKEVGYQSKINFYKAFEKTYHCKPNELRKQILNG